MEENLIHGGKSNRNPFLSFSECYFRLLQGGYLIYYWLLIHDWSVLFCWLKHLHLVSFVLLSDFLLLNSAFSCALSMFYELCKLPWEGFCILHLSDLEGLWRKWRNSKRVDMCVCTQTDFIFLPVCSLISLSTSLHPTLSLMHTYACYMFLQLVVFWAGNFFSSGSPKAKIIGTLSHWH